MKVQVGMADLTPLSERVEGAGGPDRELDREVWAALVANPPASLVHVGRIEVPAYTASLDSALGLVERVLPGWAWRVEFVAKWRPGGPFYGADLTDGIKPASRRAGPTPALAVLAALLKALRP
jgi:hypothetical protein